MGAIPSFPASLEVGFMVSSIWLSKVSTMSTVDSSSDNLLSNYTVFPQNVGKWEGIVRFLDGDLQELKRYKIAQTFEEVVDKWVLTNTYIYPDGTTATQSFHLIPSGSRKVRLEVVGEDPRFKDYDLTALEQEDNVITFKVINKATGKPREIETITFAGKDHRVRTATFFAEDSTLKGFLIIKEERI